MEEEGDLNSSPIVPVDAICQRRPSRLISRGNGSSTQLEVLGSL